MPTKHVYHIVVSTPENGPKIDFELPENSAVSWLSSYAVVEGKAPIDQYVPIRFTIHHREAENWDFYRCAGTMGIISQRVENVLGPHTSRCFNLLECYINQTRFYFLGEKDTFDCLDHEASEFSWFDFEPRTLFRIEQYRFKKDIIPDPMLFMIPEGRFGIFGTDTIRELIQEHGFKGFWILDAEHPDLWKFLRGELAPPA